MSKENNLTDFLTDVADAIREKKGTTEKINPQDFSDEIKSIKTSTSSSMWTGHVDVEGLKAIGWDDDDIAYFQEHGVNWMEEDDEYYKVSDDNKALYGVLTADNIQEYKDRIVWLPKIDFSTKVYAGGAFSNCSNMIGLPLIDTSNCVLMMNFFLYCYSLTCIPPLNTSKSTALNGFCKNCYSLVFVPQIDISASPTMYAMFQSCYSLQYIPYMDTQHVTNFGYTVIDCKSLLKVLFVIHNDNVFEYAQCIKECYIEGMTKNVIFKNSPMIYKDSVLYVIEHEAATEAITITLHASAYARLATDPDIIAALNNHPLVSLASA